MRTLGIQRALRGAKLITRPLYGRVAGIYFVPVGRNVGLFKAAVGNRVDLAPCGARPYGAGQEGQCHQKFGTMVHRKPPKVLGETVRSMECFCSRRLVATAKIPFNKNFLQ
jgi:hypothetical protein